MRIENRFWGRKKKKKNTQNTSAIFIDAEVKLIIIMLGKKEGKKHA